MKIFLDTNVWRYIVDQDAGLDLARISRRNRVEVLVSPAVVSETLGLLDINTRDKVLALVAKAIWSRLMPDAYSECEELKSEIRRLRPEWVLTNPNLAEVRRLRYDWVRRSGGFWDRARTGFRRAATDESVRTKHEHELAREESYRMREHIALGSQAGASSHLQLVATVPDSATAGWDGNPVAYWRIPSLHVLRSELLIYTSPYREWLDSEIDVGAMLADSASLNRLWLYELDASAVPRQWIRGAFEFLQGWHKVTDGTPVDSQLATHLVEADIFVSADKNFVRFAQRCKEEAPFRVSTAHRIPAGRPGIDELFRLISSKSSKCGVA